MKRSFWNYLVSTPLHRAFLLVIILGFILTMFVIISWIIKGPVKVDRSVYWSPIYSYTNYKNATSFDNQISARYAIGVAIYSNKK